MSHVILQNILLGKLNLIKGKSLRKRNCIADPSITPTVKYIFLKCPNISFNANSQNEFTYKLQFSFSA